MLQRRLRQIEDRVKAQAKRSKHEQQYIRLLDLPKETVIATFGILKDIGGYQLIFRPEQVALADKEQLDALNKLTPGQFYDLMLTQRLAGVRCRPFSPSDPGVQEQNQSILEQG